MIQGQPSYQQVKSELDRYIECYLRNVNVPFKEIKRTKEYFVVDNDGVMIITFFASVDVLIQPEKAIDRIEFKMSIPRGSDDVSR